MWATPSHVVGVVWGFSLTPSTVYGGLHQPNFNRINLTNNFNIVNLKPIKWMCLIWLLISIEHLSFYLFLNSVWSGRGINNEHQKPCIQQRWEYNSKYANHSKLNSQNNWGIYMTLQWKSSLWRWNIFIELRELRGKWLWHWFGFGN